MTLDADIEQLLSLRGNGTGYDALLHDLKKRIRSGEKSCSPLRDFLIVALNIAGRIYEEPYENLAARLKQGELIFLERTYMGLVGFSGIIAPKDTPEHYICSRSRLQFGQVRGHLAFDLVKGVAYIPCDTHTLVVDECRQEVQEPIPVDPFDMRYYGQVASSQVDRGFMVYDLDEFLRAHPCPFKT
ncbi:MAG: hypothetical protein ABIJ21_01810 [Nanoarchaeota archaeon]